MTTWRRDRKKEKSRLAAAAFSPFIRFLGHYINCVDSLCIVRFVIYSLSSQIDWRLIMKRQQTIISLASSVRSSLSRASCRLCLPLLIPIGFHLVSCEQTRANDKSERERGIREDRCSHCIPVAMYNTQTLILFSANRIQTEGVFVLGWHNLYWWRWRRRAKRKFTLGKDNGKADCRTF